MPEHRMTGQPATNLAGTLRPEVCELRREVAILNALAARLTLELSRINEVWQHDYGPDVEIDDLLAEARAALEGTK